MQDPLESPLFASGPVFPLRWSEREDRPLVGPTTRFRTRLGSMDLDHGDERLDDHLDDESQERIRSAVSRAPSGEPVHVGPVAFREVFGDAAWFDLTLVVERRPGEVATVTATAVDVTGSRLAESELATKSERLELVLEGTRLGLWDWNPKTGEVHFNERWASMLGHTLAEIPFTLDAWQSRVHPDDLDSCFQDIQAHIVGHTTFYENVHRMRHRDGHWVHIRDRGRVVERDADGAPIRFIGTYTDIPAQRHAEFAARAATKTKTQILAMMSHEIRTPLNGMLGMIQVLEGTDLDHEQRELLRVAAASGDHLMHLLGGVLDLSRVEAGEVALDPSPFDLGAMIAETVATHRPSAAAKGLELTHDLPGDGGPWIVADDRRLRQILGNLVSNAIRFTDAGSVRIAHRLADSGDRMRLKLTVDDTGRGIRDLERVFESFSQEGATSARNHGGSGLGLTISRHLAQLMRGTLFASSEVGRGSRFTLDVPAVLAEREKAASEVSSAPASLDHLRVLVVEDNPVNQRVAIGMFRRLGVRVEVAVDGQEAVESCLAEPFDIVLMDLHMPGVGGLDATRELCATLGENAPYIVALTADVSRECLAACREVRMQGVIPKPFKLERLEAELRRWSVART